MSAKVVLAGDSNAGKTCLARRLAEDCYVEGQITTHGMQIWTLPPEKLHPDGKAPVGQLREVFLWDLGGQREYQLVNQLFLHDTTVALVLFDPTRGAVGLQSAEDWHERLVARGVSSIQKLLIRSKADEKGVVQEADVEALRQRLGFSKYIAVSAKQDGDTGVTTLRHALHEAIDWGNLTAVSRPPSFQSIRNHIAITRQNGEAVLYVTDLKKQLAKRAVSYEPGELETTLQHLAREGQIVDIRLQSGDRVLILRVDIISRYAGSLVQAARMHDRGVPVLEQDRILSAGMEFPGIDEADRLQPRQQERIVLESVVRLMVERGLCFDHQGLLIFPTLFDDLASREGALPPSAPIYYDFNGPIDNIYASLVARLTVSEKFGPVRLWARYAEFGASGGETFGIRRADRSRGRGHLDLFFDGKTSPERRLFRDFVDDHLASQGVKILSGLAFPCRKCGFEFSEDLLANRLRDGRTEVTCPQCEECYSLFAISPTPESAREMAALKTDIEERTRRSEQRVAAAMAKPSEPTNAPLRILHLSDLHFTGDTRLDSVLQPLEADLRGNLKVERLDYLVVSGDFADKCNESGWTHAGEFIGEIRKDFGLDALRIILTPGNHDYVQSMDHFTVEMQLLHSDKDGNPIVGGVPKPNDRYKTRFERFSKFYHDLYSTKPYPEEPSKQFDLFSDSDTRLRFLALNSAWQIDKFNPERASLNNGALSSALRQSGPVKLGILIWHHAVTGDRKVADTDAIKRLAEAGYRILLHGDVHEERDHLLNYLDPGHRIHVVGGGTFGALAHDRPESTPRLYSLLEVARDLSKVHVIRRRQNKPEGPYEAYAIYTGPDENTKKADYTITMN